MKTVFSSLREVAHVFAANTQNEGRAASMFFSDGVIYSYGYHFPIAKFVEKEGENYLLFTLRSYSVSTTKHIAYVEQATSHIKKIYCYNPKGSHSDNFKFWYDKIKELSNKLLKARKPEKYLSDIRYQIDQAEKYANFFSIELSEELKVVAEAPEVVALDIAKIEKEASDKAKALLEKYAKEDLRKWKNFETLSIYNRNGEDYLRFNKAKNRIETSQQIQIPYAVAKDIFTYIMETVKVGGCVECDKYVLNRYRVREVNAKRVIIGCHNISMDEIRNVAVEAGIA